MQRTHPVYDVNIFIRRTMGKKKKESFCGDTFNSLEKIDTKFKWSKAYSWCLDLPSEDATSKHLKTIGLVKSGCMP